MSCKCRVCTDGRKYHDLIKDFTKDDYHFMEYMYTKLAHAEDDVCYYRAILDGSWPSSVEVLERALKRAVKNEKEK